MSSVTNKKIVCRFCESPLHHQVLDLGMSPPCESFLAAEELDSMERFYPLRLFLCTDCWLLQLQEYIAPEEIFREYAYFSSYSSSWVEHARRFAGDATRRLRLGPSSLVVEVASNDGYLLQHFRDARVRVLGVEPARNVAQVALERGIPTVTEFFGREMALGLVAREGQADLVVGNNVLAQVPHLNDFVAGLHALLAPDGVLCLEFPHLMKLVEENQFDTIYHEHYSYFSLSSARRILAAHGLRVFDVEELRTHGGSLRVWAAREGSQAHPTSTRVGQLLWREEAAGTEGTGYYARFAEKVEQVRWNLLEFLIKARRRGKRVAGYGAPGKGNTLLNYCGVREDLLAFTVDRNPYKHGRFLPGTHVPVRSPQALLDEKPDYVLILPWNLKDEIVQQMAEVQQWGGQFVVPIPDVRVLA